MDYGKEFKKYATKHHGVNAMYYDKIVSSMTPYIIEERQMNVAHVVGYPHDIKGNALMAYVILYNTSRRFKWKRICIQ